jgi:hypothetical protein
MTLKSKIILYLRIRAPRYSRERRLLPIRNHRLLPVCFAFGDYTSLYTYETSRIFILVMTLNSKIILYLRFGVPSYSFEVVVKRPSFNANLFTPALPMEIIQDDTRIIYFTK